MDFAYTLALDQKRSGYPLFSDGISTKEQFVDHVWKSYEDNDRDLLLFMIDGVVEGWIQFFYIEKDRYLQTNGFFINENTEQALAEFMEYTRMHFGVLTYILDSREGTPAQSLSYRNKIAG